MTVTAVFETTQALRNRIGSVVEDGVSRVHIGPPLRNEVGQARVSLFLFHLQVNAELRNQIRRSPPPALQPSEQSGEIINALPLDLRYMITVFRLPDHTAIEPNELITLGEIIRILHSDPMVSSINMPGQLVRMTPEPYPMEEVSRVWHLFPQDVYRTSMVYLASPVFIEAGDIPAGPLVRQRNQENGLQEPGVTDGGL